jgi:hypothetical protein
MNDAIGHILRRDIGFSHNVSLFAEIPGNPVRPRLDILEGKFLSLLIRQKRLQGFFGENVLSLNGRNL